MSDIHLDFVDLIGLLAAVFVILSFSLREQRRMRQVAILSNLLFLAYAVGEGLPPVFLLHVILFVINIWMLVRPSHRQADRTKKPRPEKPVYRRG